jgi:hypothetical protein
VSLYISKPGPLEPGAIVVLDGVSEEDGSILAGNETNRLGTALSTPGAGTTRTIAIT